MTMHITEIVLLIVAVCFLIVFILYWKVSTKNKRLQYELKIELERYNRLLIQFYSKAPQMMDDDD